MDKQFVKHEKQFLGSGWAFPVTFSFGNYELSLSTFEENVNHSIDIILKTRMGERCLEPNFGSGVQQYCFRKLDATLQGEIVDAIKAALLNNEPRITVQDVKVDFVDPAKGKTKVTVVYVYNQTNSRHNYVFPFYIKEGTNLQP